MHRLLIAAFFLIATPAAAQPAAPQPETPLDQIAVRDGCQRGQTEGETASARTVLTKDERLRGTSCFNDGQRDGERMAREKQYPGWFVAGAATGFAGVVPAGATYGLAMKKEGPAVPGEMWSGVRGRGSERYQKGFRSGYEKAANQQRRRAALYGGLAGMAALVATLVVAN